MGLMTTIFGALFGGGRNAVAETVQVFRANAEATAARAHDLDSAALQQLAAEFGHRQRGWFDSLMDGVNRLPRPLLVMGIIWLLVETARNPQRMSEVFAAWAVLPEAAWIVFGVVVTFYFGGRAQLKDQEFQGGLVRAAAQASAMAAKPPEPPATSMSPGTASTTTNSSLELAAVDATENPALADWLRSQE